MSTSNVLITTTSSIDGRAVEQYRGIVSTRVVTGTGLFSDWAASFSDFFGGRSESYNKQLKSIYDEVMALLADEAKAAGANVILGLRIDHDEISGKGKQMFMVTATGTAARIDNLEIEGPASMPEVSLERFEAELNKLRFLKQIGEANDLSPLLANWEYVVQNRIAEVMDKVFYYGCSDDYFYHEIHRYFSAVDPDAAAAFLYGRLQGDRGHGLAVKLLKGLNLLDLGKTLELLDSPSFPARKSALQLLNGRKRTYVPSDIGLLEAIEHRLQQPEGLFPDRGRAAGDRWECECGKTNKSGQEYCKSCDKDIKGFTKDEVSVSLALAHVNETRFVLKHLFKTFTPD